MKARLLPVLGLFLLIFNASCNFTENIAVNPDGSGKMSLEMDASQLMALAGQQMAKEGQKKLDSNFTFKEYLASKKDSIAKLPKAEQERFKKLENVTVHMVMDIENSACKLTMLSDFKKAADMGDMMKGFSNLGSMNKKEALPDLGLSKAKADISYFYDGKKFKKTILLPETKAAVPDSVSVYKALFEGSTYTVNYSFPKKIKSVSNKSAIIGADKKSVSIAYPLNEYLETPKALELEIEFGKK